MMECRDVRELADSFLSEQLLVETNHELLRHLETCPVCRREMADRRALRDTLRSAFVHAEDLSPRPEFVAALRTVLRSSRSGITRRSVLQSWCVPGVLEAVALGAAGRQRQHRIQTIEGLNRRLLVGRKYGANRSTARSSLQFRSFVSRQCQRHAAQRTSAELLRTGH